MTESTQATFGGPGAAGHPDLEDLAALVDGNCRGTEAARLRAHLASCEECYEVFLDTLRLCEANVAVVAAAVPMVGATPVPVPTRGNLRPHLWLAAAALLVAASVIFIFRVLGHTEPSLSVAALAAQTGTVDKHDLDRLAWGERTRGPGSSTEDPSFRLGVELLNLQVALREGDKGSADAAAAAINGLFDSITFADPDSKAFYRKLRLRLPKERPEDLSGEAAKEAKVVRNSESVGDLELDLGSWAEAGRFAAYTGNRAFFDQRSVQHFLDKLPKEQPPSEAIAALKAIDAKLAAPNLQPKDYEDLKSAFDQILRAYYPQGERGSL